MASTTIHTLSYKIVADSQKFTSGLMSAKTEKAQLDKILANSTPAEKHKLALEKLEKLHATGKISASQYASSVSKIDDELNKAANAMNNAATAGNKATGMFGNLEKRLMGMAGPLMGAAAAWKSIDTFRETISKFDRQADAADRFGMVIDDYIRLEHALVRGAEVSPDSAINLIDRLLKNIELSSRDMGKAKEFFGELGLSAEKLSQISTLPALEQVLQVGELIGKLPKTERGLFLEKLVGTSDESTVAFFGNVTGELEKWTEHAEKFGLLTGESRQGLEGYIEKSRDLADRWEGITDKLTIRILPVMERVVEAIDKIVWAMDKPFMGNLLTGNTIGMSQEATKLGISSAGAAPSVSVSNAGSLFSMSGWGMLAGQWAANMNKQTEVLQAIDGKMQQQIENQQSEQAKID